MAAGDPRSTSERPAVERRHPPDWLMRLVNPLVHRLLVRGRGGIGEQLMLIRVTGRRSGRRLEIAAGRQQVDGRLAAMTNSPWRLNFRGGRECEVVLAGVAREARGELLEDPEQVAAIYDRLIGEIGVKDAQRRLGIKVNVARRPTLEELVEATRRARLSVILFTFES